MYAKSDVPAKNAPRKVPSKANQFWDILKGKKCPGERLQKMSLIFGKRDELILLSVK